MQDTPAGKRAEGEFARLVGVPPACQTAREFGQSGRWKSQLSSQPPIQVGRPPLGTPGPACLAAESCFQTLKSQVAAAVEYLTRNPAVSDALSSQFQAANPRTRSTIPVTLKLQQLLATYSGTSWGPFNRCILVWNTLDSHWFQLTERSFVRNSSFEEFSTAAQALLQKVRADYAADESEYQQLLAFNDRYTGLERVERVQASYKQAFKNDDVAAMIRERQGMQHGLEQARARKQLLTQQSAQLVQYEHALADSVTAVEREGLTSFTGQQTQTAMGVLRDELARLSQMAPRQRGDISAKLDMLASQMRDIDSAIDSARTMKTQAEQTRRKLVENEGAARRLLDRATSEELKGAFDQDFMNSTNELIAQFSEMGSGDLSGIHQRQEDIDAARRKLAVVQNQVLDAEARYHRAKSLDGKRQAIMQKIAGALSELEQPEIRGKLGNDGVAVIEGLKSYQATLKGFDGVRLIDRIDYSDTLAAADDALAKTQQFKNEIAQVAQLVNDLQELNRKIDRRGRRLLDGPTSSTVADIGKSVSRLSVAKIPLSSEARLQFSNTRLS